MIFIKILIFVNLISHQHDNDTICLYAKNPNKAKYQLLINIREFLGSRYCDDSKAFIEYSNDMDNINKNIEEYNPSKKRKINMVSNKELNSIITELFVAGRKIIKEQDKYACSPTGKGLERQTKVIQDQGRKNK